MPTDTATPAVDTPPPPPPPPPPPAETAQQRSADLQSSRVPSAEKAEPKGLETPGLQTTPEFQQKLDSHAEAKAARQESAPAIQQSADLQSSRVPPGGHGDAPGQRADNAGPEPKGLQPTPEIQQKFDDHTAAKAARQESAPTIQQNADLQSSRVPPADPADASPTDRTAQPPAATTAAPSTDRPADTMPGRPAEAPANQQAESAPTRRPESQAPADEARFAPTEVTQPQMADGARPETRATQPAETVRSASPDVSLAGPAQGIDGQNSRAPSESPSNQPPSDGTAAPTAGPTATRPTDQPPAQPLGTILNHPAETPRDHQVETAPTRHPDSQATADGPRRAQTEAAQPRMADVARPETRATQPSETARLASPDVSSAGSAQAARERWTEAPEPASALPDRSAPTEQAEPAEQVPAERPTPAERPGLAAPPERTDPATTESVAAMKPDAQLSGWTSATKTPERATPVATDPNVADRPPSAEVGTDRPSVIPKESPDDAGAGQPMTPDPKLIIETPERSEPTERPEARPEVADARLTDSPTTHSHETRAGPTDSASPVERSPQTPSVEGTRQAEPAHTDASERTWPATEDGEQRVFMADSFIANGAEVGHDPQYTRVGSDEMTMRVSTNIERMPGYHDVIIHAPPAEATNPAYFTPDGQRDGFPTHVAQIAEAIRENPNYSEGQPIRLLSCHSGETGIAQELASALGAEVVAPSDRVGFAGPDAPGGYRPIIANGGFWAAYDPRQQRLFTVMPSADSAVLDYDK